MTVHIKGNKTNSFLSFVTPEMVQPNAVDLKLLSVWSMHGCFTLDEDNKKHRHKIEVQPDDEGYFHLKEGQSYEISFDHDVRIGDDEAGFVIVRSTLNRNGCFITSGLYDSGYGKDALAPMAACLHINGGDARIKKGTRVAQFLVWKAESLNSYNGDYGKGGIHDRHLQ